MVRALSTSHVATQTFGHGEWYTAASSSAPSMPQPWISTTGRPMRVREARSGAKPKSTSASGIISSAAPSGAKVWMTRSSNSNQSMSSIPRTLPWKKPPWNRFTVCPRRAMAHANS